MEQLIKRIVALAEKLENVSAEYSDAADDIALSLVKTAQYVGSQGYWIRNERCFSNCYRQKRASAPKKASQEIWFECQEEYQKSINNDGGSWDKYANKNLDIKIANTIKANPDAEDVMDKLISEAGASMRDECLSLSEKMLNIAENLHDLHPELHKEAANISGELLKESWGWGKKKPADQPYKEMYPEKPSQAPQYPPAKVQPQTKQQLPMSNPGSGTEQPVGTNNAAQQPSAQLNKLQQQLKSLKYYMDQDKLGLEFMKIPNGNTKDTAIANMTNVVQTAWQQINQLAQQTRASVQQAMQQAIQSYKQPQNTGYDPNQSAVPNFSPFNYSYAPGKAASSNKKVLFKL